MMRKMLLAAALSVTAMTAHADYQCNVTPRDDVIVSPQTVQVKGENGNLVITPDGNVMYNGKQYSLNAAQREQAKDYQAELRSTLPWIDEGAKSRVEKARIALDKIIVQEMGESSKMRSRLTKLDAQLKEQMNRIIVAIRRDDSILLAQHTRHRNGVHTVLAGFVEVGETLEQAVAREVMEESGIKVKNLRYVTSQPWPFPQSLMTAFMAEYDSGDIVIDPKELLEANWYRYDDLPLLPPPGTVARRLIEDTVAMCRAEYE